MCIHGNLFQYTADSTTTQPALHLSADDLTQGSAVKIESDSDSNVARSVGYIANVHASGTKAQVLHLVQKAAGASTAVNKPASALWLLNQTRLKPYLYMVQVPHLAMVYL